MLKKRFAILFSALLLCLAGCSAASPRQPGARPATGSVSSPAMDMDGSAESIYSGEQGVQEIADSKLNGVTGGVMIPAAAVERKIIQTASFRLETKDYEGTLKALMDQISADGGYIEQSGSSGDPAQGTANASYTVRVPVGKYDGFKAFVPSLGNVVHSSEGGEDVTTQYFDTDARLTVLNAQEKRILELLAKAETVEDMLKIETELTNIRTELEQLTALLKRLDDLVAFATVSLDIYQAEQFTPMIDNSFSARFMQTVKDSAAGLLNVLQSFMFLLIWLLPYLIVGLLVFLLVRHSLKRRKKNAAQATAVSVQEPPAPPAPPAS